MKDLKIYNSGDFPAYLPKLNSLYDDLFDGGKGFRSKLVKKFSKFLEIDDSGYRLMAQTVEFIHNASLLHDDLIDRSHLRREKTAAWLKYTPEYAVLAGDYLLARVMVNLSIHGNVELIRYTSETISDLLEGEWIQDSLVRDWDLTLEQLDRVHDLKTASLFKWCFRAPFYYIEDQRQGLHGTLNEMATILGQLFQRGDDLLDFDVRNDEGKALLGDLKSGYLNSFAVFLSRDLSKESKKRFIQSQTMADVIEAVGESYFKEKLQAFDDENIKRIGIYRHLIERLRDHLRSSQEGLLTELDRLPELLYWRKN